LEKSIHFAITPVWSVIQNIRKKIKNKLEDSVPEADLDNTLICAVELAENAVKYAESIPSMQYIQFHLKLENKLIEIEISNGASRSADLNKVTSTIDRINAGTDPQQLYLNRLNELMTDDRPGNSQLGLLRIANETGFELSYKSSRDILTVIARKKIQG
jgi:hypothetical protein